MLCSEKDGSYAAARQGSTRSTTVGLSCTRSPHVAQEDKARQQEQDAEEALSEDDEGELMDDEGLDGWGGPRKRARG